MLLPISITFRGFEGTPEIEAYVREEAEKLEKYFAPITSCRVILECPQRAPSGAVYHIRIDLGVPQGELVVRHDPSLHGELKHLNVTRSHAEAADVRVHTDLRRTIHEAFKEMRRRLQDHARKLREDTKRHQEPQLRGRVSRIFPEQDHGFVKMDDGREIYFHRESVLQSRFDRIRVGTEVEFLEESGNKGPQATTLRIRHPRKQVREAAQTVVRHAKPA